MPPKLIIFDCDGVLVDSEPLANQIFIDMVAYYGVHLDPDWLFAHFVGRALVDNIRHIRDDFGVTLPEDFAERYRAATRKQLAEQVQPVAGIETLLDSLTVPYCVASSGRHDKIRTTLGATGLLPRFSDRMFSAFDVAAPKPAPDVFLLAARTMQVAPEHCLVIEDSPSGVRAGVAAGMTVYGHAAHLPAQTLLDCGAARTFAHMGQLQEYLQEML